MSKYYNEEYNIARLAISSVSLLVFVLVSLIMYDKNNKLSKYDKR